MTPTTAQDLDNAAALVEAAVRLLQQAKPVMERALVEPRGLATSEQRAVAAVLAPIFRQALELVRVHEDQVQGARAALEKVTAK